MQHQKGSIRAGIHLEYVWDDGEVMFILLLVELLEVGGVFAFTVGGHLVPHLSLLSCLQTNGKEKKEKKEKDKHTHTHAS